MNNPTPLVVANLKENKTWPQINSWLDEVGKSAKDFRGTVIFCPSHPFLASAKDKIEKESIPIKLGAQDISRLEQGAYTGEVAASQISDLVEYTIIGHSERRKEFKETTEDLEEKVKKANAAGITPIFCVQNEQTPIPQSIKIVAYEPIFAIGTGNTDTPDHIKTICERLKAKGERTLLYGGSASATNVKSIIDKAHVDGFLVGATNSLDPAKFMAILQALN